MKQNWSADLAEARRRTDEHLGRRTPLVPDAPPFRPEDEYAETLPSGGAIGWLAASLAGLLAVVLLCWSLWAPRVLGWFR